MNIQGLIYRKAGAKKAHVIKFKIGPDFVANLYETIYNMNRLNTLLDEHNVPKYSSLPKVRTFEIVKEISRPMADIRLVIDYD